ncbi:MAG: hypothetical protein DRH10_04275, partial [Deltaproteobacteria bacterium]
TKRGKSFQTPLSWIGLVLYYVSRFRGNDTPRRLTSFVIPAQAGAGFKRKPQFSPEVLGSGIIEMLCEHLSSY